MSTDTLTKHWVKADLRLPSPDLQVIVITKDFRCLAYVDQEHEWHYARNHKRLADVIAWRDED